MTKTPSKRKRRFASLAEQIELRDVILANSIPNGQNEEDRIWHRGVRLDVLARKVSPDLNANHITTVAKSLGFTIVWPAPDFMGEASPLQALTDRIRRLEEAFVRNGFDL